LIRPRLGYRTEPECRTRFRTAPAQPQSEMISPGNCPVGFAKLVTAAGKDRSMASVKSCQLGLG
jgi:hypothetical protein